MAIFTADNFDRPPRRDRARRVGWTIVIVAVIAAIVFALVPTSYVIEQPGPVYNTIGKTVVNGDTVPVLSVSGHAVYPTSGSLDMLTVNLDGAPGATPDWAHVVAAWFNPSQAVLPIDEVYAPQQTVEQSNKQGAEEMTDSQQEATAAALYEQHIPFTSVVSVTGTIKGTPAVGVMKAGDILETVNGHNFVDADQLHRLVVKNGTKKPMTLDFIREGVEQSVQLTPKSSSEGVLFGVYVVEKYTFPFNVKVQLQDVGGPSAGMMFALGIIDKLTPGELNGGKHIAGTGTITAYGTVGAIGGIRQKMYGARDAGATYFLAPASNCGGDDGVRGHIPAGLTVYATSSLRQSVADLKAIASGVGLNKLQTCG
ncbi:MAG TPA: S16 family serine protease [Galbitalea sp.]|nr:S16 family serine protease [Galbitalea sp.]